MEYSERELRDMSAVAYMYKRFDVQTRLLSAAESMRHGDEVGALWWLDLAEKVDRTGSQRQVMGLCKSAIACPTAA